jgi:transposase
MSATTISPDEVTLLKQEIVVLRRQIEWLKQKLFGGGQSEKLDRAQQLLELGELEKLVAAPEQLVEQISYERPAGPAPKRTLPAESFAHLPVQETIVIEPDPVKADPTLYEKIGEERTFEVDVIPPKLFKREIVRPKYRHRLDRNRAPLLAPAPVRVVPGGFASAGLIAWALTAKYADHLPLYRQEKMLARWGAPISRQNLCDWVGAATALLEPLAKRMKQDLLKSGYVQADETPVKCNDPDLRDGKTTTGYLWALSRPGDDVIFEWRLSRKHEEAERLLGGFAGVLQSDGYAAYPDYVRTHPKVAWVGCWAHARRKFFEANDERPADATRALGLIAQLYRCETQWDEDQVGDRRAALRQEHFARPLADLKTLAQELLAGPVLPRSGMGQACTYLLGHWAPLTAHLQYSHTKLDTNAVENAIRPSKLGAKNWLFIGHPKAGDRTAVLYSLIVSAQRRGLDPHAYLKDVLTRLPAMTNHDDLTPLLPATWRPASAS